MKSNIYNVIAKEKWSYKTSSVLYCNVCVKNDNEARVGMSIDLQNMIQQHGMYWKEEGHCYRLT